MFVLVCSCGLIRSIALSVKTTKLKHDLFKNHTYIYTPPNLYPPTYLCELQFHLISIERLPGDKSVSIFGLQPASLPLPYYRELILCALRRFQVLRKIFGSDLYAACEGNIVLGELNGPLGLLLPRNVTQVFFFFVKPIVKGFSVH